ncbi:hypothetical protein JY96_09245 [Aquabacterium sp. NJ1]|nr:hypothetical protein JY96_09245 [Aquabacterium sp. NJ1]
MPQVLPGRSPHPAPQQAPGWRRLHAHPAAVRQPPAARGDGPPACRPSAATAPRPRPAPGHTPSASGPMTPPGN